MIFTHPITSNQTESGTLTFSGRAIPYVIRRSLHRKRTIALKVINQTVVIMSPIQTPPQHLIEFAFRREAWIVNQLHRQLHRPVESPFFRAPFFRELDTGRILHLLGDAKQLRIDESGTHPDGCDLMGDIIHISITTTTDPDERYYRIWRLLLDWLRHQAESIFSARLQHWSGIMSLPFTGFKLSSAQGYWGMCTRHNHIRLSWRLVMTSVALIDYVIVHELAHVKHKNHSKHFWAVVAIYIPDHKERRKRLRKSSLSF